MKVKIKVIKNNHDDVLNACIIILKAQGYDVEVESYSDKTVNFRDHGVTRTVTKKSKRVRCYTWDTAKHEAGIKYALAKGRFDFSYEGMSDHKRMSFHSSICNVAKKIFKDYPKFTWTTETLRKSKVIAIYVTPVKL
ncbi:hypothetical protein [Flavobacterium sp.]|jgi:hypothetical protein|uniref:hypothetical protein n=1 Tax=Flavobacterium sp. TaxID=239 RepID=UPI0037BF6245